MAAGGKQRVGSRVESQDSRGVPSVRLLISVSGLLAASPAMIRQLSTIDCRLSTVNIVDFIRDKSLFHQSRVVAVAELESPSLGTCASRCLFGQPYPRRRILGSH